MVLCGQFAFVSICDVPSDLESKDCMLFFQHTFSRHRLFEFILVLLCGRVRAKIFDVDCFGTNGALTDLCRALLLIVVSIAPGFCVVNFLHVTRLHGMNCVQADWCMALLLIFASIVLRFRVVGISPTEF